MILLSGICAFNLDVQGISCQQAGGRAMGMDRRHRHKGSPNVVTQAILIIHTANTSNDRGKMRSQLYWVDRSQHRLYIKGALTQFKGPNAIQSPTILSYMGYNANQMPIIS